MDLMQIFLGAVVTVYFLGGLGLAAHAHKEDRKTGIKISGGKIFLRIFVGPLPPIMILPAAIFVCAVTPQMWLRPYLIPFGKRLWKRIYATFGHK